MAASLPVGVGHPNHEAVVVPDAMDRDTLGRNERRYSGSPVVGNVDYAQRPTALSLQAIAPKAASRRRGTADATGS